MLVIVGHGQVGLVDSRVVLIHGDVGVLVSLEVV